MARALRLEDLSELQRACVANWLSNGGSHHVAPLLNDYSRLTLTIGAAGNVVVELTGAEARELATLDRRGDWLWEVAFGDGDG